MAFSGLTSHPLQDDTLACVAKEHGPSKKRQLEEDQIQKGSGHKVRVCNPATGDERCCIEVRPQMSVLEVKAAIEKEIGLVKHAQRLFFESSIFHNKQLLANAAPEMFGNASAQVSLILRGSKEQLRTLEALAESQPKECAVLYSLARLYGLHQHISECQELVERRSLMECLRDMEDQVDLRADLRGLETLLQDRALHRRLQEDEFVRMALETDGYLSPFDLMLLGRALEVWLQEDDEFLRMALEMDTPTKSRLCGGLSPIALMVLVIARSNIQKNEELAMEIMQGVEDPLFLASLLPDLMTVPSFVAVTVQRDGLALRYASKELRGDARIVRLAIGQNGMALEHAAPALKADPGIVLAAVSKAGLSLGHAADPLRASLRIVERALETDPMALQFAHQTIRTNRKIIAHAVRRQGAALQFASSELQSDRSVVLSAVSHDGCAFRFACNSLRSDPAAVQDAIALSHKAFSYAAPELQVNKLVILCAAKSFLAVQEPKLHVQHELSEQAIVSYVEARIGVFVSAAPEPLLEALLQFHQVAVAAIKHSLDTWEKLPMEMRAAREVALAAVEGDPKMFSQLPHSVRRDFTIMVAAALKDELAYTSMLKTDVWMVQSAVAKLRAAQC